jgi:hypothetical protein
MTCIFSFPTSVADGGPVPTSRGASGLVRGSMFWEPDDHLGCAVENADHPFWNGDVSLLFLQLGGVHFPFPLLQISNSFCSNRYNVVNSIVPKMAKPQDHSSHSSSYLKHKADAADLSILEKLDTIPAALSVCQLSRSEFGIGMITDCYEVANTFASIFTRPLRSKETRPESYYRYVALTAIRTMTRRLNVKQQQ